MLPTACFIKFCRSRAATWIIVVAGLLAPIAAPIAQAQDTADSTVIAMDPLEVTATPFNISAGTAPFAVSRRSRSNAELNTDPALSLEQITSTIPGLWVNTRTHYATGQRITMRGLGWRSQFGVRGIQIVMDGIPLTVADGQAILNIVDPSFIRDVEVIRGPASTFWGNASGGVLYLSTKPPRDAKHQVRARQVLGSYGLSKTDLQVTPNLGGQHRLSAYTSYLAQDGFRDHSSVKLSRTGLTGTYALGEDRGLQYFGAYSNMPRADNPSSLDDSTAAANPRSVRDLVLSQDLGKTSQQGQFGVSYFDRTGAGLLRATAFGTFRRVENPIPFGYIDLNRRAGGTRLTLQNQTGALEWGAGLEGQLQRDARQEFGNDAGDPGEQQIDQLETVTNGAAFGRASLALTERLRLSAGARFDVLRFEADVNLGDASAGGRTFQALSPSVGLTYEAGPGARLFANVNTALEAPTTSELGNRPEGTGGFNPDLEPERTVGLEAGAQGTLQNLGATYDVAVFAMRVRNLLEPFENENGTTLFRNAGETRHVGAEAALQWALPRDVGLTASYTLVRATFSDAEIGETNLDGNRVPGIPEQVVAGTVTWRPAPVWFALELRGVSSFQVNSQNTAENAGYLVVDARASLPNLHLTPRLAASPFVAVDNALDKRYNDTVVNAFGGRYYEPAAGRHWSAGLTLQVE